jgi:hypothetical protein
MSERCLWNKQVKPASSPLSVPERGRGEVALQCPFEPQPWGPLQTVDHADDTFSDTLLQSVGHRLQYLHLGGVSRGFVASDGAS